MRVKSGLVTWLGFGLMLNAAYAGHMELDQDAHDGHVIWSVEDPLVPKNQTSSINACMKLTLKLMDGVLHYSPQGLRDVVWRCISAGGCPCPKSNMLTGDYFELAEKGILRFLLDKYRNHEVEKQENWINFYVGPVPMMMPLDPKTSYQILSSPNMTRGMAYDRLVEFFGYGIFTHRIEKRWREQRNIVVHLFYKNSLKSMAQGMYEGLFEELTRASKEAQGEPIDLVLLLSRMGLFAFSDSVLGINVRDIADNLAHAVNNVLAYINGALEPVRIPFGEKYNRFVRDRDFVHDWMKEAIMRVSEANSRGRTLDNALVNKILNSQFDNQDTLVEMMISMVLGGHETTARLMLGAIYGVVQHPHYIKEIRREFAAFRKTYGDTWFEAYALRDALPRTHSIVDEALRLFPPVWLVSRTPSSYTEIDGQQIHVGTQILINFLLLHRLKSLWGKDAEVFRAERFDNLSDETRKLFFPFAAGHARCPGGEFARMEAVFVIASLFSFFDVKIADENAKVKINPVSAGTLRIFPELFVRIMPR